MTTGITVIWLTFFTFLLLSFRYHFCWILKYSSFQIQSLDCNFQQGILKAFYKLCSTKKLLWKEKQKKIFLEAVGESWGSVNGKVATQLYKDWNCRANGLFLKARSLSSQSQYLLLLLVVLHFCRKPVSLFEDLLVLSGRCQPEGSFSLVVALNVKLCMPTGDNRRSLRNRNPWRLTKCLEVLEVTCGSEMPQAEKG